MRGFLKCQHCGALLRVTNYSKFFWYFYVPLVAALMFLLIAYRWTNVLAGLDPTAIWIALVGMIFITFIFAVWRHANVEQVDSQKPPGVG